MSVWRRSMSSTRRMSEHPNPAYNLPDTDTGGAATEAAEAAEAAEAVIEAAAAAVGGEVAVAAAAAVEAALGSGSDGAIE